MAWFVYEREPIDSGWEHLKTVRQTIQGLAEAPDGGDTSDIESFLARWREARFEASSHSSWAGDFRHEPCVFWLPTRDDGFVCAFVFKQDRAGVTFIVSPIRLEWLEG